MSPNQTLIETYSENWNVLFHKLKGVPERERASPFLLQYDEQKLNNSDLRIMIFGQETWNWCNEEGLQADVSSLMARYDNFFNKKNFYSGYKSSAFWKGFRFFEKELISRLNAKSPYFCWNNISKIGRRGKGVNSDVRAIEREYFSVIRKELALFDPHAVIFMTGARDHDLSHHFKPDYLPHSDKMPIKNIASIHSKYLPQPTIRINHPMALKQFSQHKNEALDFIANNVKT